MRKMCGHLAVRMMALAALPILAMSGCATRDNERNTFVPEAKLPDVRSAGLKMVWERGLPLEAGERITKAWRVGTSVYLATSESRIARFDAKSGVRVWEKGLGRENFEIYKPIEIRPLEGPPKEALVVTRGEVFRMDLATGDWTSYHPRMSVSANPLLIGNTLCIGGASTFRGMYLDRPDEKIWNINAPEDLFLSHPVAVGDDLIVASKNGVLWRMSAKNGDWDWKDRKVDGFVAGGIAADNHAVYVPCMNEHLYAFNVDNGGYLWDTRLAGILDVTPIAAGPIVLTIGRGRGLFGVDRENGDIKWNIEHIAQLGTATESVLWALDDQANFVKISVPTGQVLSTIESPGLQFVLRNSEDDNVILVTQSGMVGMYATK